LHTDTLCSPLSCCQDLAPSEHGSGQRLVRCTTFGFFRKNPQQETDTISAYSTLGHSTTFVLKIGNRRGQIAPRFPQALLGFRVKISGFLRKSLRGIRVIPVLVEGALMPRLGDLPEDLKSMVRRQALGVSHDRFRADSERLVGAVGRALKEAREQRQREESSHFSDRRHPRPHLRV
jgi:hypothetical protein